jgi:hypothetical protein
MKVHICKDSMHNISIDQAKDKIISVCNRLLMSVEMSTIQVYLNLTS